jgi:hypothetical protein
LGRRNRYGKQFWSLVHLSMICRPKMVIFA